MLVRLGSLHHLRFSLFSIAVDSIAPSFSEPVLPKVGEILVPPLVGSRVSATVVVPTGLQERLEAPPARENDPALGRGMASVKEVLAQQRLQKKIVPLKALRQLGTPKRASLLLGRRATGRVHPSPLDVEVKIEITGRAQSMNQRSL